MMSATWTMTKNTITMMKMSDREVINNDKNGEITDFHEKDVHNNNDYYRLEKYKIIKNHNYFH